ncbi:hypothetical protein FE783_30140 [Paenibacillus mesophilus]|uniref:O-antigen ligase family protein n=1 Tax=Paenibacillus mesophilus TaxID=2582849 RepID=UPI00110D8097|nr:O-antigen ligase family protein [Paenibacillus mesophilus]TMV45122.1 hypothetical protein FE783_30140 [Paenibacillus mesophilus]
MAVVQKKSQYRLAREGTGLQEHHSILFGSVVVFIVAFLFIAPFQTALFYGAKVQYESPIYSAIVWTSLAALLVTVYLFKSWRLREIRDLYALAVWGIPLSYCVSLLFAATWHHAENLLLFHLMYAIFFVIGLYFSRNRVGNSIIRYGIVGSAYLIVVYCLLNVFGNVYFFDAVMRSGEELRLTSVFQYANAYAGFLIIPLLCCLYLIVVSRKWYATAVHALMLVPVLLSFFLTLSRGGLVMLPFILLAFLPFLSFARQILFFVYLIVGSAASFLITDKIKNIASEVLTVMVERRGPDFKVEDTLSFFDPLSFGGWSLLLLTSAATCAVIVLVHKLLAPLLEKGLGRISGARFANLYVPALIVVGVICGAVVIAGNAAIVNLLPEALAQRVQSINLQQHSVLERFTMYRDTFKALKDYPLFGAGGNAWSVLYPQYANNPYTVNQVHSYPLQYMVETGIVGILILLAFVGSIFYSFARTYFVDRPADRERNLIFYAVVVALLFHSMMDFEMSYVYISALVFLSLGGMVSGVSNPIRVRWLHGKEEKSKYGLPVVLGLISVMLLIVSAIQWKASRNFTGAMQLAQQGKSLEEVLVPLDKAIESQPDNPYYVLTKVDFLGQVYAKSQNEAYYEESSRLLASIKKYEPYDRRVFEAQYKHYIEKNRWADALALMQEGLQHYPWVIEMYERAASLHLQLGDQSRREGKKEAMNSHWSAAIELHEQVLARMKKLESLPKEQNAGSPFYVTPNLALTLGQVHYLRGDTAKSAELLATTTGDQLASEVSRPGTRWYLAALKKAGRLDQALYDRFVAKYPEEKQEIEAIVSITL